MKTRGPLMLRRSHTMTVLVPLVLLVPTAHADEVQLLPTSARLVGPKARQRFLVEVRARDAWVADRGAKTVFAVDDPRIVEVADDGTITPKGNGSATLTATVDGRSTRAAISVESFDQDVPWSFTNHVESVLTKAGCNSG